MAEELSWQKRWVKRAKRGDRRAFAELYRRYSGPLYSRILMPRLGNREAAEDALSETFRTVLERLEQFEDRGKGIWPWLARIAVNKANDQHRRHARSDKALTSFEHLIGPLASAPLEPESMVETAQRQGQLAERVQEVLSVINPRYTRAISLRFLEQRSRTDCAQHLEVKLGTFDVVLLRALRSFRAAWDRELSE